MTKQKQSLITDDTEPAKDCIWNKISSTGKSLGLYKYTNNKWSKINIESNESSTPIVDHEITYYKVINPTNFGSTYTITSLCQALMLDTNGNVGLFNGANAYATFMQMQENTTIYAFSFVPSIMGSSDEGGVIKLNSLKNYLKQMDFENVDDMFQEISKEEYDKIIKQYIPNINITI